jgi:ABC-type Zn uptake system ZnuABC Zn-binding protein ZnuA
MLKLLITLILLLATFKSMAIYYYIFLIAIFFFLAPVGPVIQASGSNATTESKISETPAISNSNLSDLILQQIPKITVVASFFPIYEFAKQVGGERANIITLIPTGIEPHDYEPSSNSYNRQKVQMSYFIMDLDLRIPG